MRITSKQLRQIIKEEVQKRMQEGFGQDRTFATHDPSDVSVDVDPRRVSADYAARRKSTERQALDRARRAELRAQGSTNWDAVYDIVSARFDLRAGPDGVWTMTGYRPEAGAPRGSTHMLEGNYGSLTYLVHYGGPLGPGWRFAKDISFDDVGPLQRYSYDDVLLFVKQFEQNFPGAFDQAKINREESRRIGGPGPNATKLDPLMIPIPYFDDFKDVVVTWVTNSLTGENRPIPWPVDQGLT